MDRIPIIVFGDDSYEVDNLLIDLSEVLIFRKELVFYTDFISTDEHEVLLQNEAIDYNSQRVVIRCPCNVSLKALNQYSDFKSWLIGFEMKYHNRKLNLITDSLRKKLDFFLIISIFQEEKNVELIGIPEKSLDLTLEQNILHKISQDTERSVNKMKRVLSEKIKLKDLDQELIETLLDFEGEKVELKSNILKKEIQNFYSGSKRSFFIFSRLNLLSSMNFYANIGSKSLLETIDYYQASIERIITFIHNEWGEDFAILVKNGKKANALDSMQSLWG